MITGFNINKIEIRSYNYGKVEKININHELKFTRPPSISTQLTPFGDKSVLRMEYNLHISYSPNMGYMIFGGIVDYFTDNYDEITKEWENPNNEITNRIKTECSNFIFQNIISIALLLSRATNLPPVVNIPNVVFTNKKKERQEIQNYIG